MTPERFATIKTVLANRQPDLTVITDEVHKGRNLSAIVRTCDAVGIGEFHCVVPRKGYRPYRGTALGSHKWVETRHHDSVEAGVAELKQKGFRIVAANLSERAVNYHEVDYTQPTAILMGTEKEGVSDAALALCDQEVNIPMCGMVESYNVSVACAIILVEAQRQRQLANMYGERRIPDEEYNLKLFQWCQPMMAAYCEERGLDYPELDEEGDLKNPSEWYAQVRSESVESG